MEVRDHLAYPRHAARHGPNQVVLIAVVDAHVRIRRPDQHCIDSAVALFKIVEITVDRVSVRDRIVKIAVFHHHLRLEKARLGPLERGQVVARAIVADSNPAFVAPVADVGQPGIVLVLACTEWNRLPTHLSC